MNFFFQKATNATYIKKIKNKIIYTVTVPHHKKILINRATSAYLHSHIGSGSISEES